MYRKAAVLKADVHMFDFRRTSFRNVTDLVSESVQKWELLQLSGCSVHSSEIHFQEVLKIEETLFICLKKRYNRFRRTGRCSRDQKEQTECMGLGLDGMQKMNGVINADLMTVEEIHQKLLQNFAGGWKK